MNEKDSQDWHRTVWLTSVVLSTFLLGLLWYAGSDFGGSLDPCTGAVGQAEAESKVRSEIQDRAKDDGHRISRYGQEVTDRDGETFSIQGYFDVEYEMGGRQRIEYNATVSPDSMGCPSIDYMSAEQVGGVR